jgi:hypothetical protein
MDDLGFNLAPQQQQVTEPTNILGLTAYDITYLITCFACSIPSIDVQFIYKITERTGITNPPMIMQDITDQFYAQLNILKNTITDLINCNYHIGDDDDPAAWIPGTTPATVQDLKDTLFYIVAREFNNYGGEWMYNLNNGSESISLLQQFMNNVVDLCVQQTSGGDYNLFIQKVTIINE